MTVENPIVSNFVKLLEKATENCTAKYAEELKQSGQQMIEAVARGEKIVDYDDGSFVTLDSYSGGAAKEGAWGSLSVRFHYPDGSSSVRSYAEIPAKDSANVESV